MREMSAQGKRKPAFPSLPRRWLPDGVRPVCGSVAAWQRSCGSAGKAVIFAGRAVAVVGRYNDPTVQGWPFCSLFLSLRDEGQPHQIEALVHRRD